MAKIRKVPESETKYQYQFICPGCEQEHAFDDRWQFNQDFDKPTISPSYLITYDHSSSENNKKAKEFYKKHKRYPTREELPYDLHDRCHSFIKNGLIQFLNDCTHKLKGQTVKLPENTLK
jgi:hypothetical protein